MKKLFISLPFKLLLGIVISILGLGNDGIACNITGDGALAPMLTGYCKIQKIYL